MTVSFENDSDVIVYALENGICYARRTQQIFVAQCVWWLASIISLEQELVIDIDKIRILFEAPVTEEKEISATPRDLQQERSTSSVPNHTREDSADLDSRRSRILEECEEVLKKSQWLREITCLKAKGRARTGRINPLKATNDSLRVRKRTSNNKHIKTEGICESDIQQRKSEGECLHCAWPSDRKGAHGVKDCIRPIELDFGTAYHPNGKQYQRRQPVPEESYCASDDIADSEDDSDQEE